MTQELGKVNMSDFLRKKTSMHRWISGAGLALIVVGVAGCGGGGDSDSDGGGSNGSLTDTEFNPAAMTISSEADVRVSSEASVQASNRSISNENALNNLPIGAEIASPELPELVEDLGLEIISLVMSPVAASETISGSCGGSVVVDPSEDGREIKLTFRDYCEQSGSDSIVYNGYIDYDFRDEAGDSFTADYDFTTIYLGVTSQTVGSIDCTPSGCTYSDVFAGTNGKNYRIEDVSVVESDATYSVSAKVFDEDAGYVTFTSSGLSLCSSGTGFSSGQIQVTDSTGSAVLQIDFSGCLSYTATYGGTAYTIEY